MESPFRENRKTNLLTLILLCRFILMLKHFHCESFMSYCLSLQIFGVVYEMSHFSQTTMHARKSANNNQ